MGATKSKARQFFEVYLAALNTRLETAGLPTIARASDLPKRKRQRLLAEILDGGTPDAQSREHEELRLRVAYYEHLIDDILLPDATAHFKAARSGDSKPTIDAEVKRQTKELATQHGAKAAAESAKVRRKAAGIKMQYTQRLWREFHDRAESERVSAIGARLEKDILQGKSYPNHPGMKVQALSERTIRDHVRGLRSSKT